MALPDAALGLVQSAGVSRAAAVDGSFPVQVGPPPPASPEEIKKKHEGTEVDRFTAPSTALYIERKKTPKH